MIFWYSATGNSYWAAKTIADALGETLVSVTDALKSGGPLSYTLTPQETLGFVFPVHAWNPPQTLLDFISRMQLDGFDGQYVFALATCGDSSGAAMRILSKALGKKGLPVDSKWEIAMPNNYLPMYDVDSPGLERAKLAQAETEVARIRDLILEREPDTRLINGRFGIFLSTVAGFLFRRFAIRSSPFYATDACISCGRCARICLTGAIRMGAGKPEWQGRCDHCCACINRCPAKAIQYGKATEQRGRYCHPILRGVRLS
jgi:ferredoxin/flavodoxin